MSAGSESLVDVRDARVVELRQKMCDVPLTQDEALELRGLRLAQIGASPVPASSAETRWWQ